MKSRHLKPVQNSPLLSMGYRNTQHNARNLTSHTYNEGLAEQIYDQLDNYAELMGNWFTAMENALEKAEEDNDKVY